MAYTFLLVSGQSVAVNPQTVLRPVQLSAANDAQAGQRNAVTGNEVYQHVPVNRVDVLEKRQVVADVVVVVEICYFEIRRDLGTVAVQLPIGVVRFQRKAFSR